MNRSGDTALRVVLSGKAEVFCVHDRKKRVVVTEEQVAQLGAQVGIMYQPGIHKLFECSCCDNLFVGYTDEPRYCDYCTRPLVHALGGPLPEPKGAVD